MINREQDGLIAKYVLTEYDEQIGDRIKAIFTKSTSFPDALAKERHLSSNYARKRSLRSCPAHGGDE